MVEKRGLSEIKGARMKNRFKFTATNDNLLSAVAKSLDVALKQTSVSAISRDVRNKALSGVFRALLSAGRKPGDGNILIRRK